MAFIWMDECMYLKSSGWWWKRVNKCAQMSSTWFLKLTPVVFNQHLLNMIQPQNHHHRCKHHHHLHCQHHQHNHHHHHLQHQYMFMILVHIFNVDLKQFVDIGKWQGCKLETLKHANSVNLASTLPPQFKYKCKCTKHLTLPPTKHDQQNTNTIYKTN